MNETTRIAKAQAERRRDQATAYAWGRQDAGESERDTGLSIEFGTFAYGEALAYYSDVSFSLDNIRAQYERWRAR